MKQGILSKIRKTYFVKAIITQVYCCYIRKFVENGCRNLFDKIGRDIECQYMIVLYILRQPFFNILNFLPTEIDLFLCIIYPLFLKYPILHSLTFLNKLLLRIFSIIIAIPEAIRHILPKTLIILCSRRIDRSGNSLITPNHSNTNQRQSNQIIVFPMQKDIWSGSTYHQFRPDYSKQLLQDAIQPLKNREKYLDLATGTGKILFTFCSHFKFSKGIDFNEHMLNEARTKAQNYNQAHADKKITIENVDVINLDEKETYDFITIGAALHYVTGQKVMQKIWKTLNSDGIFVALCYMFDAIRSDQCEEDSLIFQQFMDKLRPYYVFNLKQVNQRYTDPQKYSFEKFFSKVQRKHMRMQLPLLKQQFIALAKTLSPVNIYLQKFGVDPTKQLQSKIKSSKVYVICDSFRVKCYK